MRRSQADIAITAAVSAAYWIAAVWGAPATVMTIFGIALIVCPGYVWAEVLLSPRVIGLERVAVAAGLSLALPVLGGVAINAAGIPLQRAAWAGLLPAPRWRVTPCCLPSAAQADARRQAGRGCTAPGRLARCGLWRCRSDRRWCGRAFPRQRRKAGLSRLHAAMAVDEHPQCPRRRSRRRQPSGRHSALPADHPFGGHVSATWNLTLSDGQTWQRMIPVTGGHPIAARLYLLPDLARPYRYVTADEHSPGS